MKYLLDTNIISELISKKPNPNVIKFLTLIEEENVFLSVITIGEIKTGIEKLDDTNKRKNILLNWLNKELIPRFNNKIINIDLEIMQEWGKLYAKLKKEGKPIPLMDSLIASTAISKNLILVTRNEKDFYNLNISIINPFNKEIK